MAEARPAVRNCWGDTRKKSAAIMLSVSTHVSLKTKNETTKRNFWASGPTEKKNAHMVSKFGVIDFSAPCSINNAKNTFKFWVGEPHLKKNATEPKKQPLNKKGGRLTWGTYN